MGQMYVPEARIWAPQVLRNPTNPWLVQDFVPASGLTFIAGAPKSSRKSWWGVLLAMAVSSGESLGPFQVVRRANVLYIDRECGEYQAALRFQMLEAGGLGCLDDCPGLYYSQEPFYLDSHECEMDLASFVIKHQVGLVIVDTLRRSMRGDENRAEDVTRTLETFDTLRKLQCGLVLVHHINKASMSLSGQRLPTDHNLRGSGALMGAYESILNIQTAQVAGEERQFLVRGGKYVEHEAYEVSWKFEKDSKASLLWSGPGPIPMCDVLPRR